MKLKTGDKAKIRADLEPYEIYGNNSFVDDMTQFRGRSVTIDYEGDEWYSIKEDDGGWCWTDEMFEPIERCTHDKCYSDVVLMTFPVQKPWICRICEEQGTDQIPMFSDKENEYEVRVKNKNNKSTVS